MPILTDEQIDALLATDADGNLRPDIVAQIMAAAAVQNPSLYRLLNATIDNASNQEADNGQTPRQ